MNEIQRVYSCFDNSVISNIELLKKSVVLFEDDNVDYDKDLHYLVVESCFIKIYNSWESFLEEAFISYLMGSRDFQNILYDCCVAPKGYQHAYNIVKGTKSYPKWTDINEINYLSGIFFEKNGAFNCLKNNPYELEEIKHIRNYISHDSEQALKKFKNVVIRNLTSFSCQTPAEYLMTIKDGSTTYFTYYEEILRYFVDQICNNR